RCHRPEVFGHIGAHSADAYFDYCYLPTFPKAAVALRGSAGIAQWFDDFVVRARETRMKSEDFHVVEMLAMSAAYSPRIGAPMNVDLPFETATGRIRTDVWERWLENDPVRFVPARISSLGRLKSIFIDCGSRDEYFLQLGARMVAEALRRGGIGLRQEEFDDGHSGTNYRYAESLKYLAPRLAR
ncbi:MAG TPA: alpha/beta hydrolase, partial [Myxococcaceae bacterium]|nr:alpha/beta hydrolase [Myxococcaceae bacterium]